MKKTIFAVMLIMLICTSLASASSGYVKFNLYYPENESDLGNTDWILYDTIEVNVGDGDSYDYLNVREISNSGEVIQLNFDDDLIYMNVGDYEVSEDLKLKVVLTGIFPGESVSSNSVGDNDDIVVMWIELEDGTTKYLNEGSSVNFDYNKYDEENSWWDVEENEYNELVLYAEKVTDNAVSFNVETNQMYESEKTGDIIKFTLLTNGLYDFNIKYEAEDDWGGITDEEMYYGIKVSGLTESVDGGSSGVSLSDDLINGKTNYKLEVDEREIVTTTADGEWSDGSGFDVDKTDNGDGTFDWKFTFSRAGTYQLYFLSENNDAQYVLFNVEQVEQFTQNEKETSANSSNFGDMDTTTLGLVAIAILLICYTGYVYIVKGKKDSKVKKNSNVENEEPPVF